LLGQTGYIGKYFGHLDNEDIYRMAYFTNYFDFDSPTQIKVLKKAGFIVIGGAGSQVAVKYGFNYSDNYKAETKTLTGGTVYEYNIGEYNIAEYFGGIILERFSLNLGGYGAVLQIGIETDVNGNPFSIQKIDIAVKAGKITIQGD